MQSPIALLRFIARALLASAGAGLAGELAVDVLPEVAKDVWEKWNKESDRARQQEELQELVSASKEIIKEQIKEIVEELATDESSSLRNLLSDYLLQVSETVRNSMRRSEDPSGRTVPPELVPNGPNDILALLPQWTLVCNGGYKQESATIRARRRVTLTENGRECFKAIAESLSGSFPHQSLHRKSISWKLVGNMLFVEVFITTEYFPSAWVSKDFATEDAREVLAQFDAALIDAQTE